MVAKLRVKVNSWNSNKNCILLQHSFNRCSILSHWAHPICWERLQDTVESSRTAGPCREIVLSTLHRIVLKSNPTDLISDNGTQFTSSEFAEFLAVRDIKHRKVSLYYPQTNGAIGTLGVFGSWIMGQQDCDTVPCYIIYKGTHCISDHTLVGLFPR